MRDSDKDKTAPSADSGTEDKRGPAGRADKAAGSSGGSAAPGAAEKAAAALSAPPEAGDAAASRAGRLSAGSGPAGRFSADAPKSSSRAEAELIARNSAEAEAQAEKARAAEAAAESAPAAEQGAETAAAAEAAGQAEKLKFEPGLPPEGSPQAAGGAPAGPSAISRKLSAHLKREAAAIESDSRMARVLASLSRQFKPDQILVMPFRRALPFLVLGWLCVLIQISSMNMFQNNIYLISGYFDTSWVETSWLISVYMAPYATFTILLIKLRTQFGMRRYTMISMFCFLACCILSLFVRDYSTALVVRFLAGVTTAPIAAVGFLHTFEVFTPTHKVTYGISLNMLYSSLGTPTAHILGAYLFADGHAYYFYYMEIGLTCVALAIMYYVRVSPLPQGKVLGKLDFVSYPLVAAGVGLTAAVMPVGKLYWWQNAEWIGWVFAIAVICIVASLLIELNRKSPLIDIRWLFSWDMLHITLVMFTFRLLVSDQSSILSNYFVLFGLQNENLVALFLWTGFGTLLGGIICVTTLRPGGGDYLYLIGALLIAYGSFSDSFSTALTRPQDMFLSQTLIGLGTALFMGVSMSKGMTAAFARANITYVVTFIAAFQFTQSTGGILGSAFFGTLQIYLEKFHSYIIGGHLTPDNPLVAERITALGQVYAPQLPDAGQQQAIGLSRLADAATLQANVLGYNDVFRIYGYIAVALFCVLAARLLFKTVFVRYIIRRIAGGAAS